jgi:Zn-dependent protease
MKNHILMSLLFIFVLFTMTSKVHAETYRGDFCWQVFKGEDPEWTYRFGVYEKEGGHYALYGREDDGFGGITAVHGSAAIVGSDVKLAIISAGYSEAFGAWSETLSAILNFSNLSGVWHALGAIGDGSGSPRQYHTTGNINLITCP